MRAVPIIIGSGIRTVCELLRQFRRGKLPIATAGSFALYEQRLNAELSVCVTKRGVGQIEAGIYNSEEDSATCFMDLPCSRSSCQRPTWWS